MSVVIPHSAINTVSRAADPKKAIWEKIGNKLDSIEVMFNMVLVATYIRPEKTSGGIIRPDSNVQEDIWQGKVGLVLKLGPTAFVDDDHNAFYGQKADVDDWCVYKVGDAWSLNINGYPCRIVRDSGIRLKVTDPSIVF